MSDWEQLTLDSARRTDPDSSHRAVQYIVRDKSLAHHILVCTVRRFTIRHYSTTDDDMTEWAEIDMGRRQQRNVIARARGRLEAEGYLERLPLDNTDPRAKLRFVPTALAFDYVRNHT